MRPLAAALRGLFPSEVVVEARDPALPCEPLLPEEAALVAKAIDKRRREFAAVRHCARSALRRIGVAPTALLSGPQREPLWPPGVVGSMTHTDGVCAAAVARAERFVSLGIDVEPDAPVSDDLQARICTLDELGGAERLGLERGVGVRMIFCIKEAFYKCQFPISGQFLGFFDVRVRLEPERFAAELCVAAGPLARGTVIEGRWQRVGGLLAAGAWVSRDEPAKRA